MALSFPALPGIGLSLLRTFQQPQQDPLADYTPDWRDRDEQEDPLADYNPNWREQTYGVGIIGETPEMVSYPERFGVSTIGAAPTGARWPQPGMTPPELPRTPQETRLAPPPALSAQMMGVPLPSPAPSIDASRYGVDVIGEAPPTLPTPTQPVEPSRPEPRRRGLGFVDVGGGVAIPTPEQPEYGPYSIADLSAELFAIEAMPVPGPVKEAMREAAFANATPEAVQAATRGGVGNLPGIASVVGRAAGFVPEAMAAHAVGAPVLGAAAKLIPSGVRTGVPRALGAGAAALAERVAARPGLPAAAAEWVGPAVRGAATAAPRGAVGGAAFGVVTGVTEPTEWEEIPDEVVKRALEIGAFGAGLAGGFGGLAATPLGQMPLTRPPSRGQPAPPEATLPPGDRGPLGQAWDRLRGTWNERMEFGRQRSQAQATIQEGRDLISDAFRTLDLDAQTATRADVVTAFEARMAEAQRRGADPTVFNRIRDARDIAEQVAQPGVREPQTVRAEEPGAAGGPGFEPEPMRRLAPPERPEPATGPTQERGLRRRIADWLDPNRQIREAELRDRARRAEEVDAVTQLGNKVAFNRARPAAEDDPGTSFLMLDVTNMKSVNDNLGEDAGDAVIDEVAEVLRPHRSFRIGGDEFSVLVPTEQLETVQQQITEAFGAREVGGFTVALRSGVGETFAEADANIRALKEERPEGPAYRDLGQRGEQRQTELAPEPVAPEPLSRKDALATLEQQEIREARDQWMQDNRLELGPFGVKSARKEFKEGAVTRLTGGDVSAFERAGPHPRVQGWQWMDEMVQGGRVEGIGAGIAAAEPLALPEGGGELGTDIDAILQNVRSAVDAALEHPEISAKIDVSPSEAERVRNNPPVRFEFEHGQLWAGLGEMGEALRYAQQRKLGDLVGVKTVTEADPIPTTNILVRMAESHPRRARFEQRAALKKALGDDAPLVQSAMRRNQGDFVSQVVADDQVDLITERTGLSPVEFWQRARGRGAEEGWYRRNLEGQLTFQDEIEAADVEAADRPYRETFDLTPELRTQIEQEAAGLYQTETERADYIEGALTQLRHEPAREVESGPYSAGRTFGQILEDRLRDQEDVTPAPEEPLAPTPTEPVQTLEQKRERLRLLEQQADEAWERGDRPLPSTLQGIQRLQTELSDATFEGREGIARQDAFSDIKTALEARAQEVFTPEDVPGADERDNLFVQLQSGNFDQTIEGLARQFVGDTETLVSAIQRADLPSYDLTPDDLVNELMAQVRRGRIDVEPLEGPGDLVGGERVRAWLDKPYEEWGLEDYVAVKEMAVNDDVDPRRRAENLAEIGRIVPEPERPGDLVEEFDRIYELTDATPDNAAPEVWDRVSARWADYIDKAIGRVRAERAEPRPMPVDEGVEIVPPDPVSQRAALPQIAPTRPEAEGSYATYQPGYVGPVLVKDMDLEPARFQFKAQESAPITVWDPSMAGVVAAWLDPADGRIKVVNGHKRVRSAKDLGVEEMPIVRLIEAEDAAEARAVGALINMGEGRGTPVDVAKFLRDGGWGAEELAERGVPLTEAIVRDGVDIAKLQRTLFSMVARGELPVRRGAIIGRSGLNDEQQLDLYKMLAKREKSGKRLTNNEVEELIRFVQGAGETEVTQETLFGEEVIRQSNALEKAELSSYIRDRLGKDKRLFGFLTRAGRAERIEEAGAGEVEAEKAAELATGAAQLLEGYNRLSIMEGDVSRMLNEGAARIAKGENPNDVKRDTYAKVTEVLEAEIARVTGADREGGGEGDSGQSTLFERPPEYRATRWAGTAVPNVNWQAADNYGKVWNEASVRELAGAGPEAIVQTGTVPAEKLFPEVEDLEDFTFEDLRASGRPPPVVVRRKPDGEYEILDGNHRVLFWKESGFQGIPAWVVDETYGGRAAGLQEEGFDVDRPLYTGMVMRQPSRRGQPLDFGGRVWFSNNPEVANSYAISTSGWFTQAGPQPMGNQVVPVYARMDNIADFGDIHSPNYELLNRLLAALDEYGIDVPEGNRFYELTEYEGMTRAEAIPEQLAAHMLEGNLWMAEGVPTRQFERAVLDVLEDMGFDGAEFPASTEEAGDRYIVIFDAAENTRSTLSLRETPPGYTLREGPTYYDEAPWAKDVEHIEAAAEAYFGTTENPRLAGFILPDGTMLDLSEKGGPPQRTLDHRSVGFLYPEGYTPPLHREGTAIGELLDFMGRGNIRMSVATGSVIVDIIRRPTDAQIKRIGQAMRAARHSPGAPVTAYIDLTSPTGEQIASRVVHDQFALEDEIRGMIDEAMPGRRRTLEEVYDEIVDEMAFVEREEVEGGKVKAKVGMEARQLEMLQNMAASMYDDDIAWTLAKEGVQNAVDAVRAVVGGSITVEVNPDADEIIIRDTGRGMTPSVAAEEFLDPGGTDKPEGASGGYGFAKIGLLYHTDGFEMKTVAKTPQGKMMSRVWGDNKKWLQGDLEYESEPVHAETTTGTMLRIHLPPEMNKDWNKAIEYAQLYRKYNLTDTPLTVFRNGLDVSEVDPEGHRNITYPSQPTKTVEVRTPLRSTEPEPIRGVGPTPTEPTAEELLDLLEGTTETALPGPPKPKAGEHILTVDIYDSHQKLSFESSWNKIVVLNNGLFQFTQDFGYSERGRWPKYVMVDVKSHVQPGHPDYPWNNGRDKLRGFGKDEIWRQLKNRSTGVEVQKWGQLLNYLTDTVDMPAQSRRGDRPLRVWPTPSNTLDTVQKVASSDYGDKFAVVSEIVGDYVRDTIAGSGGVREYAIGRPVWGGITLYGKLLGVNLKMDALNDKFEDIRERAEDAGMDPDKLVDPAVLDTGGENMILMNPFNIYGQVLMDTGGAPTAELLAAQHLVTIVHELAHQEAGGHDQKYVGYADMYKAIVLPHAPGFLKTLTPIWEQMIADPEFHEHYQLVQDEYDADATIKLLAEVSDSRSASHSRSPNIHADDLARGAPAGRGAPAHQAALGGVGEGRAQPAGGVRAGEAGGRGIEGAGAAAVPGSVTPLAPDATVASPKEQRETVAREMRATYGSVDRARSVLREIAEIGGDMAESSLPKLATAEERTEAVAKGRAAFRWIPATGQKVGDGAKIVPEKLFQLMKAYRHPSTEIQHVIVTDAEGTIIHHRMTSTGLIDQAQMNQGDFLQALVIARDAGGQVWQVHNHPSGDPTPSGSTVPEYSDRDPGPANDDRSSTYRLQRIVERMGAQEHYGGHLVIDDDLAILIPPDDWKASQEVRVERSEWDWTHAQGPAVLGPAIVFDYLRAMPNDANRLDVFLLNGQHQIVGLDVRPAATAGNAEAWLPGLLERTGAVTAVIGTPSPAVEKRIIDRYEATDRTLPILDILNPEALTSAQGKGTLTPSQSAVPPTMEPRAEATSEAYRLLERVPDYRVTVGDEIRATGEPRSLIPEEFEGEVVQDWVKQLVVGVPRQVRYRKNKAKTNAKAWRENLSEEEREDVGAYVEGIGNLRTGKDAAQVAAEIDASPRLKKAVRDYRVAQEAARKELNAFLADIHGPEYVKFLDNYLAHFYAGPKKTRNQFSARWSEKVRSAKKRTLPTLQDAVDAGLIPITQDIAALHQMWAEVNWRGAINQRFVEELHKIVDEDGRPVIQKVGEAPAHWPRVDHPAIQKVYAREVTKKTKDGTEKKVIELWHGGAQVHPDVYQMTRQIFEEPFTNRGIRAIEGLNAWSKNVMLSFSLFHHWALTESANAALARAKNPIAGLVMVGKHLQGGLNLGGVKVTMPHREGLRLVESEAFLRDAVLHGLNVDPIPDIMAGRVMRDLRGIEARLKNVPLAGFSARKLRQFKNWWDSKLWDRYYTGLKAMAYYQLVQEEIARHPDLTEQELRVAKETIASKINDMFGGQEWESKVWLSPKMRQGAHMAFLAPDWTLSNFNVAAGAIRDVKDPLSRRILHTYWRNMLLGFGVLISGLNYALSGGGDEEDEDNRRRLPIHNEPGHKLDVDVTGLMRAVERALGREPSERRYYIKPGKQFREVLRYVTNPVDIIGAKLSPVIHEVIEQTTGHQAGQIGWPTEWAMEEMGWYESLGPRLRNAMEKFVPFAFRANNFAFTFPMSKGMSWYKAQKAYEEIIRGQVDPTRSQRLYNAVMGPRDAEKLKAEIDRAARMNGLDPEVQYGEAMASVRSGYYSQFWEAMERAGEPDTPGFNADQMREAERIGRVLAQLLVTPQGVLRSGQVRELPHDVIQRGLFKVDYVPQPPGPPGPPPELPYVMPPSF